MQDFSTKFCYGSKPINKNLACQDTFTRHCHYVKPTYDNCQWRLLRRRVWYSGRPEWQVYSPYYCGVSDDDNDYEEWENTDEEFERYDRYESIETCYFSEDD